MCDKHVEVIKEARLLAFDVISLVAMKTALTKRPSGEHYAVFAEFVSAMIGTTYQDVEDHIDRAAADAWLGLVFTSVTHGMKQAANVDLAFTFARRDAPMTAKPPALPKGKLATLLRAGGGEEFVRPQDGAKEFGLKEVQQYVGGLVERVQLRGKLSRFVMLVNEEGLLQGLPLNERASRLSGIPIVGDALVVPNGMGW